MEIVRIVNLPATIKAFTIPDEDGNYNIYISGSLAYEEQKKAYMHEMQHINDGDLDNIIDINKKELMLFLNEKASYCE